MIVMACIVELDSVDCSDDRDPLDGSLPGSPLRLGLADDEGPLGGTPISFGIALSLFSEILPSRKLFDIP